MKEILTITLLSVFFSSAAQESTAANEIDAATVVGFNTYSGLQLVNFEGLNQNLDQAGLPRASNAYLLLGGSLYYSFNGHALNAEGMGSIGFTSSQPIDGVKTEARVSSLGVNYGYRFGQGKFNLTPYVGVAIDILKVEIQDLPQSNTGIDDQIMDRTVSILSSEVASTTIGFRSLLPSGNTHLIGIDFRYQIPIDTYWHHGNFTTLDAPNLNIGGFKIGFTLAVLRSQNFFN